MSGVKNGEVQVPIYEMECKNNTDHGYTLESELAGAMMRYVECNDCGGPMQARFIGYKTVQVVQASVTEPEIKSAA